MQRRCCYNFCNMANNHYSHISPHWLSAVTEAATANSEQFAGYRRGDIFDRQKHESGTEVKAITYSAMQINEKEGDAELFVIVDI